MTSTEAKEVARQYAWDMGESLPGFRFGIGNEEEFTDNYYFDFILLTSDGQQPEEPPLAGGPIGLTVNKHNKQVQVLTHGNYAALKHREHTLTEIYQSVLDFKNGIKSLVELKEKSDLNLAQILELSRMITNTQGDKEDIYNKLSEMLYKRVNA